MTREEMLTNIIRIYGFEHESTIEFAAAMETDIDDELYSKYNGLVTFY